MSGRYDALTWAGWDYEEEAWVTRRSDAEILEEISRCETRLRVGWQWNEVGNATETLNRLNTLRSILSDSCFPMVPN
jgi:hypothetical protein